MRIANGCSAWREGKTLAGQGPRHLGWRFNPEIAASRRTIPKTVISPGMIDPSPWVKLGEALARLLRTLLLKLPARKGRLIFIQQPGGGWSWSVAEASSPVITGYVANLQAVLHVTNDSDHVVVFSLVKVCRAGHRLHIGEWQYCSRVEIDGRILSQGSIEPSLPAGARAVMRVQHTHQLVTLLGFNEMRSPEALPTTFLIEVTDQRGCRHRTQLRLDYGA